MPLLKGRPERFGCIVADPPWAYRSKMGSRVVDGVPVGLRRSAEAHYPTMPIEEIVALGEKVQAVAAEDCALLLWCPNSLVEYAVRTWQGWGFVQKQIFTWVKTSNAGTPKIGMGRFFRNATESAFLCTRGRPKALSHSLVNVALDRFTVHSKKPETLQDHCEILFSGPYLEIFARRARPNWTCLGNEIDGLDIREALDQVALGVAPALPTP